MRQTFLALALLAPIASSAPPEATKPDFSGEWTLNREKSRLQTPMPDSTLFLIEHREPAFRLTRTHVVKGKADTFSIDLTTDGKEVVKQTPEETLHSRAYWEGRKLVFDSRIVRGSREATNVVRYSLSDDGRVFTAEETFRGPKVKYDNVWVFDRVPARPAPGADLKKEVAETERAFAKTMADRDHAAFVTFLAKEAVFFSGGKAFRGADAVAASWKKLYEKPEAPFSWEPELVEVLDSGTLALSSGPVRDSAGKLIGTFTSIWRREDGRWRIVFDKGCPACPNAP